MANLPKTLRNIVATDRARACRDPQWVEDQLRVLHTDDSRVWVLVVAAEEQVPGQIVNGVPAPALAAQMEGRRCLEHDAARWAAAVWEYALGAAAQRGIPRLEPAPGLILHGVDTREGRTRRKRVQAAATEALYRGRQLLGGAR